MDDVVKVKGKPGKPKGAKTDKSKRGAVRAGMGRRDTVLGPSDDPVIVDELRRFTPLCMIAAKLNVSRHTLASYVHRTPALQLELTDRDESMIDMTHRALWDESIGNVKKDADGNRVHINVNAATFMLERLGKNRGFSQHIEVEQAEVPSFTFSRAISEVQPERET